MAFEGMYKGIDFYAPQRERRAQQAMDLQAIGQGLGAFERAEQRELQRRQLALEQQKQQQQKFDLNQQAQEAIYRYNTGQEQPGDRELITSASQFKGNAPFIDPATKEWVFPQTLEQRVFGGLGGGQAVDTTFTGAGMPPMEAPLTQPPPQQTPIGAPLPTVDEFEARQRERGIPTPQVTGGLKGTKAADVMEAQTELDIKKEYAKLSYQDRIKKAEADLKTEAGKQTVSSILGRMIEINNLLKEKNAIVHSGMPYAQRVAKQAETTEAGQKIRKSFDPATQALAEEYKNLQSTLLPFYASASGLGSKSLDSDSERKSMLASFGDPSGIFEANEAQLGNLARVFGTQQAMQQQTRQAQQGQARQLTREQIMQEIQKRGR